jgi:hypothetical protein
MSNYPDNFNSREFERVWGDKSDAEIREEAKKVLPAAIKEFVQKFNSKHDLPVEDGAMVYFSEVLEELCSDLYSISKLEAKIISENQRAAKSEINSEYDLQLLNAKTVQGI